MAFVALGQAAYACPRHDNREKLYTPPGTPTRAVSMRDSHAAELRDSHAAELRDSHAAELRDSHAAELPVLQIIEGGKAGWINPESAAAPVRRAA